MKLTKLTAALLLSGIALTLGATTSINVKSTAAATQISETAYEKIKSFTIADLSNVTKVNLAATSIGSVYKTLKEQSTWISLGYTKTEAQRIANRISISDRQTIGILTDIIANNELQFKVVLVNQPNYKTVNIGTIGKVVNPSKPSENAISEKPIVTPTTSSLSSFVKEIEIDLDYKKIGDIEIEYEVKSNGKIKAEVENEQRGIKIKDEAAQKVVEDLFVGLDAETMSHKSIKEHVMNKLNASQTGLEKFDFKVKFINGSKVDFKIK